MSSRLAISAFVVLVDVFSVVCAPSRRARKCVCVWNEQKKGGVNILNFKHDVAGGN